MVMRAGYEIERRNSDRDGSRGDDDGGGGYCSWKLLGFKMNCINPSLPSLATC